MAIPIPTIARTPNIVPTITPTDEFPLGAASGLFGAPSGLEGEKDRDWDKEGRGDVTGRVNESDESEARGDPKEELFSGKLVSLGGRLCEVDFWSEIGSGVEVSDSEIGVALLSPTEAGRETRLFSLIDSETETELFSVAE
jgi:hypothetical protein